MLAVCLFLLGCASWVSSQQLNPCPIGQTACFPDLGAASGCFARFDCADMVKKCNCTPPLKTSTTNCGTFTQPFSYRPSGSFVSTIYQLSYQACYGTPFDAVNATTYCASAMGATWPMKDYIFKGDIMSASCPQVLAGNVTFSVIIQDVITATPNSALLPAVQSLMFVLLGLLAVLLTS